MSEHLTIRSLDGLSLEAMLKGPDDPAAALILCHPHPQMGGTMNAPLLAAISESLTANGWAVLRFNFRGIGGSEGESSTGLAEVADARGAIAWVRDRFPDIPVAIAGWSFGAAVAVRAAALEPELAACVAIAPAVKEREGVTAGLPDPAGLRMVVPLLVICGANDEVVDPTDCKSWTANLEGSEVAIVAGANHFFWAKYEALTKKIAKFLAAAIEHSGKG